MESFQRCKARWNFNNEKQIGLLPDYYQNPYLSAIRKTIFQAYMWLQEKNKLMTDTQLRERWDKNWWMWSLDNKNKFPIEQSELLEKATNGWTLIGKIWEDIYLANPLSIPVGVNFEFSHYHKNTLFRVHMDIVTADPKKGITFFELGTKTTARDLYCSLKTKLEAVALYQSFGRLNLRKIHIDITSNKQAIAINPLGFSKEYLQSAALIIDTVALSVRSKGIWTSPGPQCQECPYFKKCLV